MIKVFKSIMAAFLVAVMVASCSNGSSGGGGSSSTSSLAGTVWEVGGVYLYLYEDGICSLDTGLAQPGTYDESTKTIHITSPVSIYYTYEISGNMMTLSAGGSSLYLIKES